MPTVLTSRKVTAGARDNYLGFYDANGNFIGGSPTPPATGQASGMVELLGVQEVPLTVGEPVNVQDEGDDTVLATFQFDNDQARAYIVTMAVHDQQLAANLQSTALQTIGDTTWGVADVQNAPELNVCLLHQSRAKYFDPSNRGRKAWESTLVPLATARPLGRQTMRMREAGVYRLAVVAQLSAYTPWGQTYTSDLVSSWGNDSPYFMDGKGDYPVHYMSWQGNGSLVNIPLDHVPVSAVKTAAWYNNPGGAQGAPLVVSAVSAVSKQATVALAIPIDSTGFMQYQYSRK